MEQVKESVVDCLAGCGMNLTTAELSYELDLSMDSVERAVGELLTGGVIYGGFGSGGWFLVAPTNQEG